MFDPLTRVLLIGSLAYLVFVPFGLILPALDRRDRATLIDIVASSQRLIGEGARGEV